MSTRRELLVLSGAASLLPLGSKLVRAQCTTLPTPTSPPDAAIDNFNSAWYAFNCGIWHDSDIPPGSPPSVKSLYSCLDPQAIYYRVKDRGPVGPGRDMVVNTMMQYAPRDRESFTPTTTLHVGDMILGKATWVDQNHPNGQVVNYVMRCQSSGSYLLTSLLATPDHP